MKTYRTTISITTARTAHVPLFQQEVEDYRVVSIVVQRDGHAYVTVRDDIPTERLARLDLEREVTRIERDSSREGTMLRSIELEETDDPQTR